MVYRNNAGRLGSGFVNVCLKTRWLGQKSGSMCRNDLVTRVPNSTQIKGTPLNNFVSKCSGGSAL